MNKRFCLGFACFATLLSVQIAEGQGTFQNLGFESAVVPATPSDRPVQVLTTDALPGWTAYAATYQQSQIWYNGVSIGGALVSLVDLHTRTYSNSVISGNFTATLDAGTLFLPDGTSLIASAAIAQAGTIPLGTKSLIFEASGTVDALNALVVTFSGQSLPFYPLAAGPNYTRYGADISALAGLPGELRFTEQPNAPPRIHNVTFLDNIQFSPIPEPGTLGLFAFGTLLLGWRVRSRSEA